MKKYFFVFSIFALLILFGCRSKVSEEAAYKINHGEQNNITKSEATKETFKNNKLFLRDYNLEILGYFVQPIEQGNQIVLKLKVINKEVNFLSLLNAVSPRVILKQNNKVLSLGNLKKVNNSVDSIKKGESVYYNYPLLLFNKKDPIILEVHNSLGKIIGNIQYQIK